MTHAAPQLHGPLARRSSTSQTGVMLLETLIAILIFSLGVLSIVQLQAISVKQSTEAEFRSVAAQAASDLVSRMWATDRTFPTLEAAFSSEKGGAAYTSWRDVTLKDAGLPLPSEAQYKPKVQLAADAEISGATTAVITLYWRMPGEKLVDGEGKPIAPHSYVTTVTLR